MRVRTFVGALLIFVTGTVTGLFAAKRGIDAGLYVGQKKDAAAKALLDIARVQAEKGSWENIGVGRTYYLAGMKKEGQEIFDRVTSKKPEGSDWLRIGRAYYAAGEWDKAKTAFDNALRLGSKEAGWYAEIGGYYNVRGDRAKAEELFQKSFALESNEVWNTLNVAGSYAGVEPLAER